MAHHKSAQKRIRQTARRNERNTYWRSTMRSSIKKIRLAIDAGEGDAAKALLPTTIGMINHVCSKGVIHKKTASRYISRLSKAVNRVNA